MSTPSIEDVFNEIPLTDEMKKHIYGGDKFKMGAARTCNQLAMVALGAGINYAWQSSRLRRVMLRISLFFVQATALTALLPLVEFLAVPGRGIVR